MLTISEWKPRYTTQLICGHTAPAGQKAYKLMIAVCQDDVACLPQAIKAALQAQQGQGQKPSLLYRLWHWCFGKKRSRSSAPPGAIEPRKASPERKVNPMSQVKRYTVKAKDGLQLDCGHVIKAGETLVVTSVYTCEKEKSWPLTILLACFQAFYQKQAAPQPVSVNTQAPKNVYAYNGHQQPSA